MIYVLSKSFTSTVYDVIFIVIIVFLGVSIVMWIALPIVLFSIRNELKRLNQIIKDYTTKKDIGT